ERHVDGYGVQVRSRVGKSVQEETGPPMEGPVSIAWTRPRDSGGRDRLLRRVRGGRRLRGRRATHRVLVAHRAVALEEDALVDDEAARTDVTFDVASVLQLDLVLGGDVPQHLAADDGGLHVDLPAHDPGLADHELLGS